MLAVGSVLLLLTGSTSAEIGTVAEVPLSTELPAVQPATTAPASPAPSAGPSARRTAGRTETTTTIEIRSAAVPRSTARSPSVAREPARLLVSGVSIDVPVRPVGVGSDGEMAMPDTVGAAGWYRFGARPGDRTGTTVLAGHVDTRTEGLGPFASLAAVRTGTDVTVTDRAGRRSVYRITDITRVAKHGADLTRVFDRDGAPRLQILTCAGAYDPRTGYRDLLIVTAVPV